MGLKVYNTLTGKKEEFIPLDSKKITMYVCGPTVYDNCHIGHARAYVSFDVIYRYLKYCFNNVTYVRNITDVDDKIIKKANDSGKKFEEVAGTFVDSFHEDMKALGLASPDIEPNASEHIKEMQEIVKGLIAKGIAYENSGDIYFSVDKFGNYGNLSKRDIEWMEAGARVEVSEVKKNPLDFALWKKAKEGEPSWDSPWGKGRPGWHIECSAMSSKYLGESFDIHGGGRDLIFPHHENEIAQSEAYTGKPFAKYWLHCGFLNINKEKMSKSLGNIITIKSLLERFSPDAIKYFILSSHYRSPIDFSDDLLIESEKAVLRAYNFFSAAVGFFLGGYLEKEVFYPEISGFEKEFSDAMDDDFNSAKALGIFFDYLSRGFVLINEFSNCTDGEKRKNLRAKIYNLVIPLYGASEILGLFLYKTCPDYYFQGMKDLPEEYKKELNEIRKLNLKCWSYAISNDKKNHEDITRQIITKHYALFKNSKTAGVSKEDGSLREEIDQLVNQREEFRKTKNWAKADEIRKTLLEKFKVEIDDKKDGTRWKFVK